MRATASGSTPRSRGSASAATALTDSGRAGTRHLVTNGHCIFLSTIVPGTPPGQKHRAVPPARYPTRSCAHDKPLTEHERSVEGVRSPRYRKTTVNRLRSWGATIVFLPVFALILLTFDVAQRLARLFGQRPQEYVAGALQVALVWAFRLCGTRLLVERAPGFAPGDRYIVVANHQSMFDIPILGSLLFSSFPKYISKRSLGRWIPSVSYNLRRGGHVLTARSDGPAALAAIRELGARVRTGQASAVIFPEGTRARRGTLGKFKRAGTLALLDAAPDAPVL